MNGQSHRESCCVSSSGNVRKYDLIIVGGGSAGFAAAIQAHELGKTVLMGNRLIFLYRCKCDVGTDSNR